MCSEFTTQADVQGRRDAIAHRRGTHGVKCKQLVLVEDIRFHGHLHGDETHAYVQLDLGSHLPVRVLARR